MQFEKPGGAMHDVIRQALDELRAQSNPYGCISLITNTLRSSSSNLPVLRSGRDYINASGNNNATDNPLNNSSDLSIHGLAAVHLSPSSLGEGSANRGAALSSSPTAGGIEGRRTSMSLTSDGGSGGGGTTEGYNHNNYSSGSNAHDFGLSVASATGRSFLLSSTVTPLRGAKSGIHHHLSSLPPDAMARRGMNSGAGAFTFNRTQLLRLLLIRVEAFVATRQYEKALHDALSAVEMSHEQSAEAYFILGREQQRLLHMKEAVAAFDTAELLLAAKLRACRAGEGRGGCGVGVEEPLSDAEFWAQRGFQPGEEAHLLETVTRIHSDDDDGEPAMRPAPIRRAEFESHELAAMRPGGGGSSVATILAAVLRTRSLCSVSSPHMSGASFSTPSRCAQTTVVQQQQQQQMSGTRAHIDDTHAANVSSSWGGHGSRHVGAATPPVESVSAPLTGSGGQQLSASGDANEVQGSDHGGCPPCATHPADLAATTTTATNNNEEGDNDDNGSGIITDLDVYREELTRCGLSLAEVGFCRRIARAARSLLALRSCHTVPIDVVPTILSVLQRSVTSLRGGLIVSIENTTGHDMRLLGCTAPDASYHDDFSFPEYIPRRHCGLAMLQPRSWRSFSGAVCYAVTHTLCCFFYFESPLINAIKFGVRFSEQEDNEVLRQAYEELRVSSSSSNGVGAGGSMSRGRGSTSTCSNTLAAAGIAGVTCSSCQQAGGSSAGCPAWAGQLNVSPSATNNSSSTMAPLSPAHMDCGGDKTVEEHDSRHRGDGPLMDDAHHGRVVGNERTMMTGKNACNPCGGSGEWSSDASRYSSSGLPTAGSSQPIALCPGTTATTSSNNNNRDVMLWGAGQQNQTATFSSSSSLSTTNATATQYNSTIKNTIGNHNNNNNNSMAWMSSGGSSSSNASFSTAAMSAAHRAIKIPNPSIWLTVHTASFDRNHVVCVSGQSVGPQAIGFSLHEAPPVRLRSVELLPALEFAGAAALKKLSQVSRHYRSLVNHLPPPMFHTSLRLSYPDYCLGEDLLQSPWTVRDREPVTWRVVFDHRNSTERDEYLVQDESNNNNNNNNNNNGGGNSAAAPLSPLSSSAAHTPSAAPPLPSAQAGYATILHYVSDAPGKMAGTLHYGDRRCPLLQFKESWMPFSKTVYLTTMQGRNLASFTLVTQGQFRLTVETLAAAASSAAATAAAALLHTTTNPASTAALSSAPPTNASGKETVVYTMVRRKPWERSPIASAPTHCPHAAGMDEVDEAQSNWSGEGGGSAGARCHVDAAVSRRPVSPWKEGGRVVGMGVGGSKYNMLNSSNNSNNSSMEAARGRQVCYTVWRSHRSSSVAVPGGGEVPTTPGHGADIMGEIRVTPTARAAHASLRTTVAEVALLPGADALLLVAMTLCAARWD